MAISNAFNSRGGTGIIGESVEYPITDQTSITITHKFKTKPNVCIIDPNGNIIGADVKYLSPTLILINFAISFTGLIVLR